MIEYIPIGEAPDWVQRIVEVEEVLPEELREAHRTGNQLYRAIKSPRGAFLIVYNQTTGKATDIVWI